MNRKYEIDKFLEFLHDCKSQNPDLDISDDFIYSMLTQYNLTPEELKRGSNLRPYFEYWQSYFEGKTGIHVFETDLQKKFLQFRNRVHGSDYIKMYVNVKPEAICSTVNRIFSYMSENNIEHASKVSERIRSDAIVLRVARESAEDVLDFINNDSYIVKYAKKTNPFLTREGVVGMAYDDNLSYNSCVSFLISECIRENDNNLINSDVLSNYCENFSERLKNDENFKNRFINSNCFLSDYFRLKRCDITEEELLKNFEDVFDLVAFNSKGIDNHSKVLDMYDKKDIEIDYKGILDSYLGVALQKYKTPEVISRYLESYLSGNMNAITRDQSLREKFIEHMSPEKVVEITKGDLEKYITDYIKSYKLTIFNNSCNETLNKYNLDWVEKAIVASLYGNYDGFTRTNGARQMMMSLSRQDIISCIQELAKAEGIEFEGSYGKMYVDAYKKAHEIYSSKKI